VNQTPSRLQGKPADPFLLREAIEADTRAISRLLRSAFLEFQPLYTPEAFVATVVPEVGIRTRLEEGPIWVAERQARLIGTVAAKRTADSVLVRGMAVEPTARGLGIGKALLTLTEDFARKHGCKTLSLYTTAFLNHAIRLYQSAGYRFTTEKSNPNGTELLRMVKVLGTE
jgi:GNAT superfamily N-acetyltransferase